MQHFKKCVWSVEFLWCRGNQRPEKPRTGAVSQPVRKLIWLKLIKLKLFFVRINSKF